MNQISIAMNVTLTNMLFVGFFCEIYLLAIAKYIMVIPACPHCAGEAPDEKVKINKLGPE